MSAFEMTGFIACIVGIAGLLYLFMWLSHRVDALEKAAKARKTRENALSDPVIERLKGIGWRFDDAFKRIVAIEARLYTLEEAKNPTEAPKTRGYTDDTLITERLGRIELSLDSLDTQHRHISGEIHAIRWGKNPTEAQEKRETLHKPGEVIWLEDQAQEATESNAVAS